jgi:hypothetical protein
MIRFALLLVAALWLHGPAKADWRTVKWGMSVKEVLAADKTASLLSADEQKTHSPNMFGDALVAVSAIEPGTEIRAILFFDFDRLREIKFIAPGVADGERLFAYLTAQYGEPSHQTHLQNEVCRVRRAEWDGSKSHYRLHAKLSDCTTIRGGEAILEPVNR